MIMIDSQKDGNIVPNKLNLCLINSYKNVRFLFSKLKITSDLQNARYVECHMLYQNEDQLIILPYYVQGTSFQS